MKINSIKPYNVYKRADYNNTPKRQISYTGGGQVARKASPWVLSGLLTLGGIFACATGRSTGKDTSKDYNVEYYNVKKDTKNEVVTRFERFRSDLPEGSNFLNGVTLIITDKNSSLEDDYSFKTFLKNSDNMKYAGGVSFYSDKNMPCIITIQEYPNTFHDDFYILSKTGEQSINPLLRHALLHEIGHQFDEYFGHNHDEKYARSFDSLMYIKEQDPNDNPYVYGPKNEKEKNIIENYCQKNGLSDTDEFKKAILKDFQYVSKIKRTAPGYLPINIDYYTQGLDLSMGVSQDDVERADIARSEVYANLFSYACGENDGDKTEFLNTFKNSYNIVVNDIKTYLGAKVIK